MVKNYIKHQKTPHMTLEIQVLLAGTGTTRGRVKPVYRIPILCSSIVILFGYGSLTSLTA